VADILIRQATHADIPAIVRMTFELAHETRQPIPICPQTTARFVEAVLSSPDGLALVCGVPAVGFLVATIGVPSCSRVRVAIEHGWWCGAGARGSGMALLAAYEDWARSRGCYVMRMSTPAPHAAKGALQRQGFAPVEQAWAKVL
jgi:GNAT superfamily N-acetyltransferase